jgi:mannan endo-1,4-beta-mannosidase
MAFRSYFLALAVTLWTAFFAIAQTYRFEAENGTRVGTNIATNKSGYSGTGFVTGFDSDTDSVSVNVSTVPAGMYELWVGYNSQFGHKGYGVQVGSEIGDGSFDGTPASGFYTDRAGLFKLDSGATTLKITKSWGYYDVDYFELRASAPHPVAPVAPQLVDPLATTRTQLLMNYLSSIYGVKTLAGQQGNVGQSGPFPSSAYLSKSNNLVPAVRGSDFIEYSPSRIAHGSNPNGETERIIDWARSTGGIPTMMWHWNAPTDLIDTPGHEWWRGFYTDSTTFDVQAALASPGSPKYNLLLSDMDAIAAQLKKFDTAGVPVLWRPLHEAQGQWFWWGAKGPGPFVQLWHLMYDRLTNYHGLHNLIWEFTSSPADQGHLDWYPGDDYVDIVGEDVYTNASSSQSGQWLDLLNVYDGRKMIALSETGTLPKADLLRERGIEWSYFSPWSVTDTVNNYSAADLQALLGDSDVITLNELPYMPWNYASLITGDFDHNGVVDTADYAIWRDSVGQTGAHLAADANGNNQIDAGDYDVWRSHFGQTVGSGSSLSAAVPEPATVSLSAIVLVGAAMRRRHF